MNFESPVFLWLFFISLYLVVLSFFFFWFLRRLNKLIKNNDQKGLIKAFEEVTRKEKENAGEIDSLAKKIEALVKEEVTHIQKVGLVRFNPFNETGGDHSFSLALLNGKNDGWVMTGLHTRERTRVYVKPIKNLKSDYELSQEEKKALEEAMKQK